MNAETARLLRDQFVKTPQVLDGMICAPKRRTLLNQKCHPGHRIQPNSTVVMTTPLGGVDILFLLFPASGVRCPASRMVSAHLKEKY